LFPNQAWADCTIATISGRKLVLSGLPLSSQIIREEIFTSKSLKEKSAHQVRTQIAFMAEETHSIQHGARTRRKHVQPRPNGSTDPRRTPPPHSLLSENAHPSKS
jgi:hypothetical protein